MLKCEWAKTAQRGVSFLELGVVLIIIVVMSAFMAPTMKGMYERNQLKAAARELAGLARYARQAAILRGAATELRINMKSDTYQLALDVDKKQEFRISHQEELDAMQRERELGSKRGLLYFKDVSAATKESFGGEKAARLRFFRNGSATPATIVIADKEGRQMTVEVAGGTGMVRVYSGGPKGREQGESGSGATATRGEVER